MKLRRVAENNNFEQYASNRRAWYAVVVLTAAYIVSFLDRQLLALVVEDVKAYCWDLLLHCSIQPWEYP